ncbi:hypothetical protein S40288_02328 [Stachybotrys chartarum IBT 40288]|nr:hypothetical protein S40288_02328 [Stachybotrys chartarum IBT 40288]
MTEVTTRGAQRRPPQEPASFDVTPTQVLEQTEAILCCTRALHDALVARLCPDTASFATLVAPLLDDDRRSCGRLSRFRMLSSVSADASLREACRVAEQRANQADAVALMRSDVASLVAAVFTRADSDGLDPEDLYALRKLHRAYQSAGAGLLGEERRQAYLAKVEELNRVVLAAKKTLNDADEGVWLSALELEGVPRGVLDRMSQRDDGKYKVTFVKGQFAAVMKHAGKAKTRKTLQLARDIRFPENVERLQRVVVLRDEVARMLGFATHAEKKMQLRMAESAEAVVERLTELTEKLAPVRDREKEALMELKREYVAVSSDAEDPEDAGRLNVWDVQFYKRILEERRHRMDAVLVSEYFEVENSLRGMLGIFERLFSMRFMPVEAPVWHDTVVVYTAWDAPDLGGQFLGYLYLDLYSRDGKYKGARCSLIEPGYETESGRNYPSTALICSFARPPGKPTLLLHGEVKTMFHELGHAIHKLVTLTKHHHTCARDFVEIPSVMLENWIWVPDVLVRLGRHYSYVSEDYYAHWKGSAAGQRPAEEMPREMARDLARTKNLLGALTTLPSVHLATFDMVIHSPSSTEEARRMDTTEVYARTRADIVGLGVKAGIPQASFAHMFRGYDAAYFTYCLRVPRPSSRVYAADLWLTCFASDPMNEEVGMRYRRLVLQPGGSRPEMQSLEAFLGRRPGVEAFFREVLG